MEHILALLDRLIAFPTVSRDGNIALIQYVAGLLAENGIEARLFPAEGGDRASLFATLGPQGPGGIVLSGHTDVVPVDGQAWTSDPFRLTRRGDRLLGRGTADMKGFVACAIEVICSADRFSLRRPLHLALSYDEEIGCVGVRPMLAEIARAGLSPAWILVGEPTGMRIATGHKGKLAARAHCRGHAVHSALAPTGLNAIHLASDFLSHIREFQQELETRGSRDPAYDIPYTTLHAGLIKGGTALNIVPEACTLDFEIRNVAGDDEKVLLDRLSEQAGRITSEARRHFPDCGIAIEVLNDYPGLESDRQSAAVQAAYGLSATKTDETLKVAFGTEAGLFTRAFEAPAVVCGPGFMDQGHKADEYVSVDQLEACRTMLSRLTAHLSGP